MFHVPPNRQVKPELEAWGVQASPSVSVFPDPSPELTGAALPASWSTQPQEETGVPAPKETTTAVEETAAGTRKTQPKEHGNEEHLLCHAKMAALQMENLRLKALLSHGISPLLATTDFNNEPEPSDKEEELGLEGDRVLVDPAVALEMVQLRARLQASESELKTLKENFNIMTSFTGEGPLGKRLLEKCRKLLRENEQLGECLIASKAAKKEQHELFAEEKTKFLMNQLRLLYELNTDLEGECSALSKAINRLAVTNNSLRQEVEKLDSANADLHRRLERLDRDRSSAVTRMPTTERSRPSHRGHSPRRRERTPSYEKPSSSRDLERRRGGGRRDM
eukprot:Gregarina_sp_Poly_1__453@NODE_110_length_13975_cov_113_221887_g97_i0_p3_GENE_NODE_110_length_13975_cov_113_221887_g97_i0NODE_110_length_13975_cov_113_221887_g97_i0_p3_ORF_typecomplete_len337_score61_88Wtap/PF17098_5/5_5e12Wtap/PF17098_5/0_13ZapB/PF06005_12/2_8e02ZapB/PF06005_12/1_5e02ZapB/PF06005_12/61ZapB/PF06005_12/0_0025Myosin_tail_1/PF01576_19/0_0051Spc42p/PF11544_8/0_0035TACC_C/PF05010_14/86TACC_C/PF05010_14/0_021DUF812/PF05667_11/0_043MAD/PF05557_13/1_9MAD/PF05557_13/0_27CCDC92/PF14916_6/1